MKVSCDAASYFHGLTSTAFLPPSLTTRNHYPAEGTGIVKQGFVALDFTGKFQVICIYIHCFFGVDCSTYLLTR